MNFTTINKSCVNSEILNNLSLAILKRYTNANFKHFTRTYCCWISALDY